MKIVSSILILITAFLSIKHGWAGVTGNVTPEEATMMSSIGVNKPLGYGIGILSMAVGLLVFFSQTFFAGNLINALIILLIMALALKSGNLKIALVEIPFLLMPLVLIWLGHPLKE
jgi:hypothetical protein